MLKVKINKAETRKLVRVSLFFVVGVLVVFLVLFGVYSIVFSNRVYAHQYIGGTNFSWKSKAEVKQIITQKSADLVSSEIKLIYKDESGSKDFVFKPSEIGINFDIDETVNQVWDVGRRESVGRSFFDQVKSIFKKTRHSSVYAYNQEVLNVKIAGMAKTVDQPEKDFSLQYKNGGFSLTSDRADGKRINQKAIISILNSRLRDFDNAPVEFESEIFKPQVSEEKALSRLDEANKIIAKGDLTLVYGGSQPLKLDVETIGGMIKSKTNGDDLELIFAEDRLDQYLNSIGTLINVDPVNAKLQIVNGKVAVFNIATIGKKLKVEESKEKIKQALISRISDSNPANVELVVEIKQPEITESSIDNLGISQLIGTGTTQFSGSPANRIHNIQVGAAALNGVLIKPGEVFSTVGRLGEINDKTGYLPELVIRDNQTVPEYGGGLCQVSTTLFRAALNAGMKITERANHSYRVSYYEPPIGMDATIYDPSPDFKFLNNYASYILVQSRIEGSRLTFDFYGTKDNRTVEISQPVGYDYVSPPDPVTTETDTLAPGERQQVQKSHQGASAKFHYKVTRSGEILQETDFISKYVALPEKWLVGKQPTPAPETPPADPSLTPATTDPAVTPAT
jgi:vancomycin resistance protein YoaR